MEIMSDTTYVITHSRRGAVIVRVTYVNNIWVDGIVCDTDDPRIEHHPDCQPGELVCMRKTMIVKVELFSEWAANNPISNEEPAQ